MRTPFKASSAKAPLIVAIAALSSLMLHCSSDDPAASGTAGATSTPTSGSSSGGSASGGVGGAAAAGTTSGGVATTAGTGGVATAGTVGTGGTPTGAAGSGGRASSGGSGGTSSGGTGGGSSGGSGSGGGSAGGSGGGGGGGSAVSFSQVQTLLANSCKGGMCHNSGTMHVDWVTAGTLYANLTTAIPDTKFHCIGDKPVIPGDAANSLLYKAIQGSTMCTKKGGGTETIGRMPDNCSGASCLSADQIKLIGDWINAGAKM